MRINPPGSIACLLMLLTFSCSKPTIEAEDKPNTSGLTKSVDPWDEVICAQEWPHYAPRQVYNEEKEKWEIQWVLIQVTFCHYVGPSIPVGTPPGSGGGGTPSWDNSSTVHPTVAGTVITDIDAYLSCFDLNSGGSLTVYVDQPNNNTDVLWNLNSGIVDVGESFIEIKQNGITRVVGFYPSVPVAPLVDPEVPGVLIDKGNKLYDVSLMKGISATELTHIVTYIKHYLDAVPDYHFVYNNNAGFATDVAYQGGFVFHNQDVEWPHSLGWGRSSALLGQYLRYIHVNSAILTEGGMSSTSAGCP